MVNWIAVVLRFLKPRLGPTVALFILSGFCTQPAVGGYGQIPLFFVENRGQAGDAVRYIVKGPRLAGYFEPAQVLVAVGQSKFRLTFPGSSPTISPEGVRPLPGRVNFLVGAANEWKVNLPTFDGITYRGIFPGVDLVYTAVDGQLKSDFILEPGVDPSTIRLQYEGAGTVRLDGGALIIPSAAGDFRENAPVIYQEINGSRVPVEGAFRLFSDGVVGFRVGSYDRSRPLLIDPVLTYSTYLGGGGSDNITGIAIDASGNAYVSGWTDSTDLPVPGAFRASISGGVDAFVAKLNPAGTALIYCTYLGGRGDDRAFGIAVDSSGNAYVTGWTSSSAFPTAWPMQSTLAGGKDAFVAKLNPAGNALVFSTYLGGNGTDSGNGIAVDASGNAYIAGYTSSTNFPVISAYQNSNRGMTDAFVTKLDAFGSLIYSTYLGGNGDDRASSIAIDTARNAYVTGGTTSTNYPVASPVQPANGGSQDAFVSKLGPSGNTLAYSTYLGGTGGGPGTAEAGNAIAVDSAGAAYVAGATSSFNFPVTAGVLQAVNMGGGDDAFIAKLNPAGNALVYCTFLGGGSLDYATGIAVDFVGNAYVAGYTASYDFLTSRPLQPGNAGLYDAFLAKVNPTGTALVSSTYLGGAGSDAANAVAVDALANAYLAGQTASTDFRLQNPYQTFNGGPYGGFVAKLSPGWTAGVFLNGAWYIDANRSGGFDPAGGDKIFAFGQSGDIPVAGDWSGSGTVRIGVFRNGQWLLDYNGNGVWDGAAGGDRLYVLGQAGDIPVTGDWSGSGTAKIGVFRGGFWMLDTNGNGQWDAAGTGDTGFWFGNSTYTPVVGDWNGSGVAKAGLFVNGSWYLDLNGDGQWTGGTDQILGFGKSGDIPLVGDWAGSGKSNIGVFRSGYWILDMNGNGMLDGIGIGESGFWLGNATFKPVVLR